MQLLKLFKELSLHPKNADELKGLILQLAVQGMLTVKWREENPNAISAYVLLKETEEKKEKLIKAKKINKEKPLPPIENDEIPYNLPENWAWCRLRDVGYTMTGGTPSKANPAFFGDDIPFIKPGDIQNWKVNYENEGLSISGRDSLGRIAPKDSILMVCLGTIGKCAIIEKDCSFNQQINSITSLSTDSIYLLYSLSSKYFYEAAWNMSTSTTIALLNKGNWESIPVPIPPLEEQQTIVEIVNQLFAEVEQLETLTKERIQIKENFVTSALQRLSQTDNTAKEWAFLQQHFPSFFTEKPNVKKLRETILHLAVQGKLTTGWRKSNPDVEPASELLKRIEAEKKKLITEKKIKKEEPPPPIGVDEIPYMLPDDWEWCRMINLCQYITDGTHQTPTYTDFGRMFLSAKNVKPFQFMPDEHKFVSEEDFDGYIKNRKPELNDILLTRVGAGIGEAALINQDLEFAIYVSVGLLKMFPKIIIPEYIVLWLNSPDGRKHSSVNTYGKGVSQGNLNLSLIRGFIVSVPPKKEQKAIVEKVNALMALCDELEQQIESGHTQIEQLMQSCLKEVFNH